MDLPDLHKAKVSGKRVLVRVDLDIPFGSFDSTQDKFAQGGPEWDDTRLRDLVPTLQFLMENQAKVILIGHKGRPNGTIDGRLTLELISKRLAKVLGKNILFVYDITGAEAEEETKKVKEGEVIMLENLRFDSREEDNDDGFAKRLASFGEIYVNECFADSHRNHASIVGIPKILPHFAGFRLAQEVENLSKVLQNPEHPVVIVIGGGKVDKAKYVDLLLARADWVLVGGVLPVKVESYCSSDNEKICVIAARLTPSGKDIDIASSTNFAAIVSNAGTVVWNGPLGEYEDAANRSGTEIVARAVAESGAFKLVGGGDTIAVLQNLGILDKMDWVSSGGGSMLEFLVEGDLVGLRALRLDNYPISRA